jgi:hypothetical protein
MLAAMLAAQFRQRRYVTLPPEAFYWLAVLVTFALGTAAGDWRLPRLLPRQRRPGAGTFGPSALLLGGFFCRDPQGDLEPRNGRSR